MSEMTLLNVMFRIKSATKESPIAVFRSAAKDKLNAVFAATIKTQELIARCDPNLIGVYDGTMNQQEIEDKLRMCVL